MVDDGLESTVSHTVTDDGLVKTSSAPIIASTAVESAKKISELRKDEQISESLVVESAMRNCEPLISESIVNIKEDILAEHIEVESHDVGNGTSFGAGLVRGVLLGMKRGMIAGIRFTFTIMFGAPLKWFRPSRVRWQEAIASRAQTTKSELLYLKTWQRLLARDGIKPVVQTIFGAVAANTVLGYIMFGVFEKAVAKFKDSPTMVNPVMANYLAGGFAGLLMSVPSTAIENVRMQTPNPQLWLRPKVGYPLLLWMKTYHRVLFKGFVLTCARDVLSVSAFFGLSYSFFESHSRHSLYAQDEKRRIPMSKTFLAGGAGAIVSDMVAQPFTRLKEERAGTYPRHTGLPVFRLYHGMNPATVLAGAIPGGCALLLFEYSKRLNE